MAPAPVKSKPLYNFSLPLLRWGNKNQINTNHRYRRPSETAEHRRSPPSEKDSVVGGGSRNDSDSENRNLEPGSRNRFSFASCFSQKEQSQLAVRERERGEVVGEREKEKVVELRDEVKGEESVAKPWNFRPRKAIAKDAAEIGRVSKNGEVLETPLTVREITEFPSAENLPKSTRLRGFAERHGSEKRKFWIALSRDEIEEDVYAMTGSKPARRPKKRPKNIQKQLDNVFPGLYLAGITADYYRAQDDLSGCKFSAEEERVVIDLQARFGNKWATIASYLQGRTDNDVKNFWSSRQKRLARILQPSSQSKPHKNKGKAMVVHEITNLQAQEFIHSPQMKEESSSKYQSCPSSCIGAPEMMQMTIMPPPDNLIAHNLANINSIVPSLDIIEPDNFGKPSTEINPLQIPNPKPEIPLMPEIHDPVLQGLGEPNFLENVSQLNIGSPFVDHESLATPESFFDELPADMFDFLEPYPSSSSSL